MIQVISVSSPPSPAIGDYGAAMENYLQSGAISSEFFESDVPPQTWTPAVYHCMISCCEKLNYHTHAAILCQFLQPVDYELAFGILKNNVESTVDSLFVHFWDMTIIEYLICILNANYTTTQPLLPIHTVTFCTNPVYNKVIEIFLQINSKPAGFFWAFSGC